MIFGKKEIKQFSPYIKRKYAKEVYKNILKGNLSPGIQTKLIEEKIKQIHNIKNCICITSGTAALMVAIKSLNLKPGSTILAPAYSFLAAHNAARFLGYKIKLVDINSTTLCMDKDNLYYTLKKTRNVGCVIFINHNAYCGGNIIEIKATCDYFHIPMVEDAAQCLGVNNAGKTGDIAILSFSVPKLATSSQGGAIITDNDKLADKCRSLIDHGGRGWRQDRIHKGIGLNLRFNDILASYLLPQLNNIELLLQKRYDIFWNYFRYGVNPRGFDIYYEANKMPWMVIYRTKRADQIIAELKKNKIEAVRYYKNIDSNPPYRTKTKFPEAERAALELVYLPSSLNLSKRQIRKICKIILEIENE